MGRSVSPDLDFLGPSLGEPLTPLNLLRRSATSFGERTAMIAGERSFTYAELEQMVKALASMLVDRGVRPGDRVAVLAANSPLMLAAHFAVPYCGAVLVALNIRLTPADLAGIVDHAGARLLLFDPDQETLAADLRVEAVSSVELEEAVKAGELAALEPRYDLSERDLIALNYTSGTTGAPKGVMYEHRGAYLQALAMAQQARLGVESVYLWTLPMFHCNGWCFPWAVTAAGGTHVCVGKIDPADIWRSIRRHRVTHMSAAPTVLTSLAEDPGAAPIQGDALEVGTGGAPPSPALLARLADLNIEVTHLYGLTETYGPSSICVWHPEWDKLDRTARAKLKSRQGVATVLGGRLKVVDEEGDQVPQDGLAIGELVLRGYNVARGYFRDPEATRAAGFHTWFRTGDLAVMHPDGYIELRDRSKDIIISGGENIPSVEVEHALCQHPDVLEAAVVGRPDQRWGETPVAFVTLRPGSQLQASELIAHARSLLPGFKSPRDVIFGDLPKTGTGKVQKYALRAALRSECSEKGTYADVS